MINIYKYIEFPLNLALTCRKWLNILKDHNTKVEWLLFRYGKVHSLFHAVRLGPTFIDLLVCQTLIKREVHISRYFIQRLLKNFGKPDQKLIELRIKNNVDTAFQQRNKSPWASNLSFSVFKYLLNEGYANTNETLLSKGDDIVVTEIEI